MSTPVKAEHGDQAQHVVVRQQGKGEIGAGKTQGHRVPPCWRSGLSNAGVWIPSLYRKSAISCTSAFHALLLASASASIGLRPLGQSIIHAIDCSCSPALPSPTTGPRRWMARTMSHSLITSLRTLKGNPRGCVYTEPLWGIPFNLICALCLGLHAGAGPDRPQHRAGIERQLGLPGLLGAASAAPSPTSWVAGARR